MGDRVGAIDLAIPKLRKGSHFPALVEPRWQYLWIDATYVKVRQAGRIVASGGAD